MQIKILSSSLIFLFGTSGIYMGDVFLGVVATDPGEKSCLEVWQL